MNDMTSEEIIKVVDNLIGDIKPEGYSDTDVIIEKNIKKLGVVIYWLTVRLENVVKYKDSRYGSMENCGIEAEKQLRNLYEMLHNELQEVAKE